MTRILVYEWCASGAARGEFPRAASLWAEGWAMLAAAVEDARRISGVQVQTILDADLRSEPTVANAVAGWPDVNVIWTKDEPAAFRAIAVDFALVIAPEFDHILETRCRWAIENGATLLGPTPEAVALTADKLALARHLKSRNVPTPETSPVGWVEERSDAGPPIEASSRPCVIKPRFGAGSQDMQTLDDVGRASQPVRDKDGLGSPSHQEMIAQPFIPGLPASVAFLIGPRETIALLPAWQDISTDGRFRYQGGSAPLPPDLADRAVRIAREAIDAVGGLCGYAGVDIILGDDGDYIIEINPRLTTSYVGLRALAETNLLETLLGLIRGESVPKPIWRSGSITWAADGSLADRET